MLCTYKCFFIQIIDKLSGAIKPAKFESIKVKKSTLEFIRFESEVSTKAVVDRVLEKIDQKVCFCNYNY